MPASRPSKLAGQRDRRLYRRRRRPTTAICGSATRPSGDSYFMTGGTLSILANRISYVFDLHGPSLTSTPPARPRWSRCTTPARRSATAASTARSSAASTCCSSPYPFLGFCRASMLSRRGRCFAFDERADGYVRGEGGGVVILKPLAQALADGDRDPRGDPRHRRQFRRPHDRPVAAERSGAGRADPLGMRARRRRARRARVFRDARHRHAGGRSDRGRRGRTRARPEPARAAADRLGQDQYRPPRTGFRHGRADQGGAGARSRRDCRRSLHCETPNPKIPFDELNLRLVREAEPIAGRTLRRRQLVRFRRHQRPCRARRHRRPHRGGGRPPPRKRTAAARHLGAHRSVAARAGAKLARHARRDAPPKRSARCCAARRAGAIIIRTALSRSAPTGPTTVAALADFAAGSKAPRSSPEPRCATGSSPLCFPATARNGRNGARRLPRDAAFRDAVAEADAALRPGARLVGRRAARKAAPTPSGWRMPISRSRCCSRSRSASSRCCAGSASRRRRISVTASARSPRPGPPARCRWPKPRESSSRAAATRSAPAATAAWRPWRWAARRRASCSPRSAARSSSARSTRPIR